VALNGGRIQGVQALSGTGGLRVYGELMKRHGHNQIYVPNPTWGNHIPIFTNSGLEVKKYRYYDAANSDLDFEGMVSDIKNMPEGSIILLHACAHNPTGSVAVLFIMIPHQTCFNHSHLMSLLFSKKNGSNSGTMERT
jgi:aspartate aminotransferase